MGEQSDEEEDRFAGKVRTLRDVAIDLTGVLKSQAKGLGSLEPGLDKTYSRIRASIMQLGHMDARQFRGWMFYFLASLFFMFVLFVLFFVF